MSRNLIISTFDVFETGSVSEAFEIPVEQFFELLVSAPKVNASGNKKLGECFTPGRFVNDSGEMVDADLQNICALSLDFDGDGHGPVTDSQRQELLKALEDLDFCHVWYETWSRGLRVVMPTARDITTEEFAELYDALSAALPTPADPKCRLPSRKSALPQVPSADRAATHRSDYLTGGPFISPGDLPALRAKAVRALVQDKTPGGTSQDTAGFKVPGAKNAADLELFLSHVVDGEKEDVLFRQSFSAACCMLRDGLAKDVVVARLQEAAHRGLQKAVAKGATVGSWTAAMNTVERKVSDALAEIERERKDALATLPPGVLKTADKLIRDKDIPALGKLLGPRVQGVVTVDVLVGGIRKMIEDDPKCEYTSVPDAVEEIGQAIQKNVPQDWQTHLRFNQNGKGGQFDASEENLVAVFTHHPDCIDLFERDVRSIQQDRLRRDAPWGQKAGEHFSEANTTMFNWVRDELKLQKPKFSVLDAVVERFVRASPEVDPFLDYLRNVKGDESTDLLSTLLIDQFGAADTPYNRAVTRKTFIAACARADRPGCWLDSVLVLYAAEGGHGKSKFWHLLVPDINWVGNIKDLAERETPIKLQRYVFSVVDEIDKWSGKKASGELKEFLTERQANTRAAYAKKESNYLRRGVMVGNTNVEKYLHDPSGARRYWTVETTHQSRLVARSQDAEYVRSVRNQLWFEAWQAYQAGEQWFFSDEEKQTLKSELTKVLTRRETSAESEALLEFMADATDLQCSAQSRGSARVGKVGLLPDQMLHGHYLPYISERQVKELFTLKGWHGANVKHALEAAGLTERRGGRMSTMWKMPDSVREQHEAAARQAYAELTSAGVAKTATWGGAFGSSTN